MSNVQRMNVFSGVHKGLRHALFNLSHQAGICDADSPEEVAGLKSLALEVFHFLEHHAANEDRFLVPMLKAKTLAFAPKMAADHAALDAEVESLKNSLEFLGDSPSNLHEFYLSLNRFLSRYLAHLHEEESDWLPVLHQHFTDAELGTFSQKSVAATEPADQAMMLGHMFPAMRASELKEFFAGAREKAPREVIQHLEGIAQRVLGARAEVIR